MLCPYCLGPVELPDRPHPAWCPACDKFFRLVDDYGWWGYTAEVYAPEDDEES